MPSTNLAPSGINLHSGHRFPCAAELRRSQPQGKHHRPDAVCGIYRDLCSGHSHGSRRGDCLCWIYCRDRRLVRHHKDSELEHDLLLSQARPGVRADYKSKPKPDGAHPKDNCLSVYLAIAYTGRKTEFIQSLIMQAIVVGNRQKINLETWERRAAFHFFKEFTEPFHGVCLRVDCTARTRYAKQHSLSVFLSLLHRSLVAAHQVENFRTRIVDGIAWRYEQINGGSAVGRANGTIGLGHYQFRKRIDEFVRERPSNSTGCGNETTSSAIRRLT